MPWKATSAIWIGAANFGLWASLFWLIYTLPERYHEISDLGYGLGGAGLWLLATAVMGVIITLLVWRLQRFENFKDESLPFYTLLFLGFGSVACVLIYFGDSALRDYYNAKWELKAGIESSMDPPGFTLFGDYNDAVSAFITKDFTNCSFPQYNVSCNSFNTLNRLTNSPPYGKATFITFNHSEAQTVSFSHATDQLLLQVSIQWNSSGIWKSYNPGQKIYPEGTVFNPTLYAILYDPRLTFDQLSRAFACGFLGWTEQPALGSTTYAIEEVTTTTDDFGLLDLGHASKDCVSLHQELYGSDSGGFRTYSYRLSSAGANGGYCDTNGSTTFRNTCFTQTLIRYGSFRTTELTSVPGIETKDIWLNIAAIMGGVAYVAAFSVIFSV